MPERPTEPLKSDAPPTTDVDLETRLFINRILGILGWITAAIGIIGEILGWWNDLGLIVTFSGLFVSVYTAMDSNGKAALAGHATTHANLRVMRQDQSSMLGNQEAMLGNQEASLEKQDRMIDGLDRIATILDERLPPSA